MIDYLIDR